MIGMSGLSLIWPSCVPSLPPKSLIFSFLEFVESSIRNVISFIALNVPTDFQREKNDQRRPMETRQGAKKCQVA